MRTRARASRPTWVLHDRTLPRHSLTHVWLPQQDTDLDDQARALLASVTNQLRDPAVVAAAIAAANTQTEARRPTHLQDLAPEDLPEASRGVITREIQSFRQRAFNRESAKQAERDEKISSGYYGASAPAVAPPSPSIANNVNGGPPRHGNYPPPSSRGGGPPGPQHHQFSPRGGGRPADPQSYTSNPIDFVRAAQQAAAQTSLNRPMTDAEEEKMHLDRKRAEAMTDFREKERRWMGRERSRGQALAREGTRETRSRGAEVERKGAMLDRLARYDDQEEEEREMFYADRARWRAMRRLAREREEREDRMDLEAERRQTEAAKRESEAFLSQQAELFAKMSGGAGGKKEDVLQLDEGTKITLSLTKPLANAAAGQGPTTVVKKDVLMEAEEDDQFKRKRELIPLTYEGVVDEEESGMTEEQKLARRQKKVRELVKSIPSDKDALFAKDVRWEKLTDVSASPSSTVCTG